ncbi:HEAT repeat domain-containing protein [Paraglaciecola aquimarina]|uniref:HEAT repeat domain-containing protein n=1 Tax=Paraglaciecola algarum TaxID=3050085 RepID=A0ABS9DC45_9ALTE|nr:PVC-type heme-binding CxxCH protein [Paraglaciecola sp. G1-23]MCF2949211.1 HEAT repeat domain-containing protein [Paraglaciecola sp. G1-23]
MKFLKTLVITSFLASSFSSIAEDKKVDLDLRIKSFSIPEDIKVDVWADTSLTKNPSYFYFDSNGRMLMTEIYRIGKGVGDVRGFSKEATIADIQIETLDDRLKLYKDFAQEFPQNQGRTVSDKIVLIEDTNNDGKADSSKVFAEGFDHPLDGLAAGVIERDNKVYFTNLPNLWMLEDINNDGVADKKESLQTGFGTRVSFLGHDMHGLAWGPDGRLYWSLGDRGYDLKTKEGNHFFAANFGAVFRSDPDGSHIEIFYHGLRNPQELVFDEYGNLFTADNDGDHGDLERINHLIEGGDSGWHAGHQNIMSFTPKLGLRSSKYTGNAKIPVAWLVNDMSVIRNKKQPAFMLPGIGQLYRGPSGLTYNPSNYLGEKWRNHFFVAQYGGAPTRSYISSFKNQTNGASFLTKEIKEFARGINVADIDFGLDGRFYISEFNFGGWENSDEGAVYALDLLDSPTELEQRNKKYHQLLIADYGKKSINELAELLAIDHQRIRQQAQFELAKRGQQAFTLFDSLAHNPKKNTFSRIHSIWGLSQLVFNHTIKSEQLASLIPLLKDKNEQVRIQTARVLGDHKAKFAEIELINALSDTNAQVAMYAANGLGRISSSSAIPTVIKKLEMTQDNDLWLRHSLVMALKGAPKQSWIHHKTHSSKDVRMGVLLALRALKDPQVADFLQDTYQVIVDEAIIAIDDKELTAVRGKVAELLDPNLVATTPEQAYIHHRIINANFNQGGTADAKRLLNYASHKGLNEDLASEALAAIEGWNDLNPIDTITGLPSLANKQRASISNIVKQQLPSIFSNTTGTSLVQAMRIAKQVNFELSPDVLSKIAKDTSANMDIRSQALQSLSELNKELGINVSKTLLEDPSDKIKAVALGVLSQQNHASANMAIERFIASDSVKLQQIGLANISAKTNNVIDKLLIDKLSALISGKGKNAIILELLNAAEKSSNQQIKALFNQYNQSLEGASLLTKFAGSLSGGDRKAGEEVFFTSGAAQCVRCHTVNGKGSNVGPDLSNIGQHNNERYLLEAMIDPSATIAPGFGTFNLTLNDGKVVSGLFYKETPTAITLGEKGKTLTTYKKSDINQIQRPPSGMPPMNYLLNNEQLRDLTAYLASLKNNKKVNTGH